VKHVVELPDHIEQRLAEKAAASGEDVGHLIRGAVGRFVEEEVAAAANGEWSAEAERRRRMLIDRDIAGTITQEEQRELARLDRMANEHFDRVAPPPIEGARRLHAELVRKRGDRD
jgi:predicted transcriptional regulator